MLVSLSPSAQVAFLIKVLQMLYFPLSTIDWPTAPSFATFLEVWSVSTLTMGVSSMQLYFAVLAIVVAWVAVYATLLAVAMAGFAIGKIPSIPLLTVLRFIANASASVLFIPLTSVLLTPWGCGLQKVSSGASCDY